MGLATVASRAHVALEAPPVSVEVDLAGGLPSFSIVGLPETTVRESKDRVRAALRNCGFEFPPRRIIVNLAPADLPKSGGRFDLPIALGVLAASGQMAGESLQGAEFVGELSLDGRLRPVGGSLSAAAAAASENVTLFLPAENGCEASLVSDARLITAPHLIAVWKHVTGQEKLSPFVPERRKTDGIKAPDLADVRGQS
ncbi:MAG: magnesium chelatase domain-containing protein, partial [Gammaproteobacteria bacterium]